MSTSPRPSKAIPLPRPRIIEAYHDTLGVRVCTHADLIEQIRTGLAISAFTHLAQVLKLPEQALADVADISSRTLTRRKETGRLQPNESDRLVRIATLLAQVIGLFEGDRDRAAHWFRTGKQALGGASPLEYANTDIGAREVADFIGRLEHGVYS